MESCKDFDTMEQPIENSWLYKYHEMMFQEEKAKAADKTGISTSNRS